MKKYVLTSNQFSHLLPMYAVFFNKYWPDQQVTVLCYDVPTFILPSNIEVVSIGKQTKNLEPVVHYFKHVCKEEYFVLLLEDLFLVDHVNTDKVDKQEQAIKNGADKASLHFYNQNESIDLENGYIELKQDAMYRSSVQPAIWTRKYFLKHLLPEHSWWSFEMQHHNTKHDGGKIIYLKEQLTPSAIFDAINIYEKGKLTIKDFKVKTDLSGNGLTHEEDVEIVKQLMELK